MSHNHYLDKTDFLLFLNKYDLFTEKLKSVKLKSFVDSYTGKCTHVGGQRQCLNDQECCANKDQASHRACDAIPEFDQQTCEDAILTRVAVVDFSSMNILFSYPSRDRFVSLLLGLKSHRQLIINNTKNFLYVHLIGHFLHLQKHKNYLLAEQIQTQKPL